jgi:hypothetical protein
MKLAIVAIIAAAATAFAVQRGPALSPAAEPIKVRGCLSGNGSKENPWVLKGAVLPAPPPAAAADGRGGAGAGRGAAPAAAAPAPAPQPPVDLQLTDIDMTPWRNMFVEVEGTVGARPATGLREFKVSAARSAYGDCK